MVLGPQFENTYWFSKDDEHGDERIGHSLLRPDRPTKPFVSDVSAPFFLDKRNQHVGSAADLQGMLFSPYVGTGLKKDPLVSPEHRQQTAEKALGFVDDNGDRIGLDAYRRNAQLIDIPYSRAYSISERTMNRDMGLMRDALVDSGMPIQEMQNVDAKVVRDTVAKNGYNGWANIESRRAALFRNQKEEKEVIPGETKTVSTPSETPIHNPKFWSWYDKNVGIGEDTYDVDRDLLNDGHKTPLSWHNPSTGETLSTSEAHERFATDYEGRDSKEQTGIAKLRDNGFYPNLFPGKAPQSGAYAGIDRKVKIGYSNRADRFKTRGVHLRFEPGETTTVQTPDRTVFKKTEVIDHGTLTHELGHTRDETGNNYTRFGRNPEPHIEGLADGYEDRYTEEKLASFFSSPEYKPEQRNYSRQGFSSSYGAKRFGPQHGKVGEAIYTAVRSHVAQRGLEDAPDVTHTIAAMRKAGADPWAAKSPAKNEFLGHIWENYPHVRQHLDSAGYGDVARRAHADWQELLATHDPKHEQLSFRI